LVVKARLWRDQYSLANPFAGRGGQFSIRAVLAPFRSASPARLLPLILCGQTVPVEQRFALLSTGESHAYACTIAIQEVTSMSVMAVPRFERFFRDTAGLDIDKNDIKRYSDFVNQQIYDLLVRGQAVAKANIRDVVEAFDLPITAGLQENIHQFRNIDEQVDLRPILAELTTRRPLDLTLTDEAEAQLSEIAGGISVALARTFKQIDPQLKNPQTEHWERAFRIFDQLL
jgi:hypothetical protein